LQAFGIAQGNEAHHVFCYAKNRWAFFIAKTYRKPYEDVNTPQAISISYPVGK
jgi:hypothetical protein